ncbi:Beta-glucuronidase [Aphelenchoides besseyi]|nr:Beta-glucuronidase [Aphelenchoides besseyi]
MYLVYFLCFFLFIPFAVSLLFPQRNEIRGLDSLDGLWTFVREPGEFVGLGLQNKWYKQDLSGFKNSTRMPVPAAFNDLTPDRSLKLYVGWIWYQTKYIAPISYAQRKLIVRFGSVNYFARVYINGELAKTHIGGHLPFDVELSNPIRTQTYYITVAVNNTFSSETIPPGQIKTISESNVSFVSNVPDYDFFPYAGILRPVAVQVLSQTFLQRLKISIISQSKYQLLYKNEFTYVTELAGKVKKSDPSIKISICLIDPEGTRLKCVVAPKQFEPIDDVQLWWPRNLGAQPLYTLEIFVYVQTELIDVYRETFGFRVIEFIDNKLHINGKPFYCVGFGMHEDFELHGRGYNEVVLTRDLNMFQWLNANCYRTSHYPYSETRAYEADRLGIVTITETPAVGLHYFNNNTLKVHEQMLREMIDRDYNHPSVIAWSISNEPHTTSESSRSYFQHLYNVAKSLESHRFITTVYGPTDPASDRTADIMDFICVNKYFGWYQSLDNIDVVEEQMYNYIKQWHTQFKKPIIVTEYGAEAIAGMYVQPSMPFSEQYQLEIIGANQRAFDRLRNESVISGEMIWNFADFMTASSLTRPLGNHKGVLTRTREPKMSAYVIQRRYGEINNGNL